ncbi:MAG: hypothetical protein A3J27_12670 [Candidatus Tectomicrobia bacterium RIFCSPLOWO2_12_FULL_69_37]|nr:MAG: hypothetical protein A3I72_00175 [Candidatus Tectomicrobia bacterium RIFCSPLOWO2_02_FULL_70_19]OGL65699.1 MAG: hypothetical protein A3J27_12670 [Candidatus Tectomicrobia bacterium RIFCSPLOWO2_12_FULL_69_37]
MPSRIRVLFLSWLALGAVLLGAGPVSAAQAAQGGFEGWLHTFNLGAGALILNPVVILIQWANFLILLILLNAILYKPLWRLMNERSGKIKGDTETAHRHRKEAQGYVSQYEDSLTEIRRENTEALFLLEQELNETGRRKHETIRVQTSRQVEEARALVAAETSRARVELRGRIQALAAEIANRLAGRKVA